MPFTQPFKSQDSPNYSIHYVDDNARWITLDEKSLIIKLKQPLTNVLNCKY